MSLKVASLPQSCTMIMVPDGLIDLQLQDDQIPVLEEDSDASDEDDFDEELLAAPTPTFATPSPSGILFKGSKHKKRVTFRDSNLCNVREIPPRSQSGSLSGDDESDEEEDYEEEEEEEDSGSSESENYSVSDSEDEADQKRPAAVTPGRNVRLPQPQPLQQPCQSQLQYQQTVVYKDKGVTVTRTTPVTHTPSVTPFSPGLAASRTAARAERGPILWSAASSYSPFATPHSPAAPASTPSSSSSNPSKSSCDGSGSSATSKVVVPFSLAASSQNNPRTRAAQSAGGRTTTPPPPPNAPSRKSVPVYSSANGNGSGPVVVRVERKVKKITPTLDSIITSQTVRSVTRQVGAAGAFPSKGVANGGAAVGRVKKKKLAHHRGHHRRSNDGGEGRQKGGGASQRSSHKLRDKVKPNSLRSPSPAANPKPPWASSPTAAVTTSKAKVTTAANGFAHVRDSLSLPPLLHDDSLMMMSSRATTHLPQAKPSAYLLEGNGFIFPGDPAHDLTAGMKAVSLAASVEGRRGALQSPGGLGGGFGRAGLAEPAAGLAPRAERINSAPPTSPVRRRRLQAWQMANGYLLNSLSEQPSITPMWETVGNSNNSSSNISTKGNSSGPFAGETPAVHASLQTSGKPAFLAER